MNTSGMYCSNVKTQISLGTHKNFYHIKAGDINLGMKNEWSYIFSSPYSFIEGCLIKLGV
jgi:hypothetical protein